MKVYIRHKTVVHFIQFKNIKLAMDIDVFTFLGEIKNDCIELNANINRFLLEKFKINKNVTNKLLKKFNKDNWDVFENDLVHIKFLVEYSPILSKFVDPSEFDNVEFINLRSNVNIMWKDAYYVDFGENVKFFKVSDVLYEKRIFSIDITPEFLKVLELWGK